MQGGAAELAKVGCVIVVWATGHEAKVRGPQPQCSASDRDVRSSPSVVAPPICSASGDAFWGGMMGGDIGAFRGHRYLRLPLRERERRVSAAVSGGQRRASISRARLLTTTMGRRPRGPS